MPHFDRITKISNKNPLTHIEERKREYNNKKRKMEEIKPVLETNIHKKKKKLQDSETDLRKRYEQMRTSLEQQARELEEKGRAFEAEKIV